MQLEEPARLNCLGKPVPQKPIVSIIMLAYNHAKYVDQAIESVLSQKTELKYELLIGEDCSIDDTLEKCLEYQTSFPEIVKVFHEKSNVGVFQNYQRLVDEAKGQYIAILEGDDYWLDDKKLDKQVALLASHPEYYWCASKTRNKPFQGTPKKSYSLGDVLRRYLFHTSSVLFRSTKKITLPRDLNTNCLDVILYARLCEQGECGFLDEELSFYRRHPGGIWTGASVETCLNETWKTCDYFLREYGKGFESQIFDRELWVYKQQVSSTGNQTQRKAWRDWSSLFGATHKRIQVVYGHRYLGYCLSMLAHGVSVSYFIFRRRLALRKRLSVLISKFRGQQ